MNSRLIEYLESSFIGDLLKKENITDISFNGRYFFFMDNIKGRRKANLDIELDKVNDFLRQIANLSESQFSYSEPQMDFSISRYRINAIHSSIGRYKDDKVPTFSIRIASEKNRIQEDKHFMDKEVKKYIQNLLDTNQSIVIAGSTGTGKTELQKYLISLLKPYTRVIVIDNVQELECLREYEDLDLTSWQVNQRIYERSFESLIRNALRSNPDWLLIAESRGREMSDVLLSVMSGHPIITTLHAYNVDEVPHRISRMVQLKNENQHYEDIFKDVTSHLKNYIFLEREIDKSGKVHRYIKSIGQYDEKNQKMKIIYERK